MNVPGPRGAGPILSGGFLALAVVALCWTGLVNGQPFFFPDTTAYIRGADMVAARVVGTTGRWSAGSGATSAVAAAENGGGTTAPAAPTRTVLAGRSVYYGAVLYLADRLGSLWLAPLLHALLAAACVTVTWLHVARGTIGGAAIVLAALAFLTPLSFYVSYLMPDLLAGLGLLACANLMAVRPMSRSIVGFWFATLLLAVVSHATHLLTTAVLTLLAVAWNVLQPSRAFVWSRIAVLAVAVAAGVLAESAFHLGVQRALGQPPVRPPFLTARLIEDGPGHRYLAETCPGNGFVVCRFLDRLPMSANGFVWSTDPARGVFSVADPATQRRLSDEQTRLAAAVVAYDPVGQLSAFARNSIRQLLQFGLETFAYSEGDSRFFSVKLPAEEYETLSQTLAARRGWPLRLLSVAVYVVVTCALVSIVLVARTGIGRPAISTAASLCGVLAAGVATNAAICGAIAMVHGRYQARVVWLVPLAAMLLWSARSAGGAVSDEAQLQIIEP